MVQDLYDFCKFPRSVEVAERRETNQNAGGESESKTHSMTIGELNEVSDNVRPIVEASGLNGLLQRNLQITQARLGEYGIAAIST